MKTIKCSFCARSWSSSQEAHGMVIAGWGGFACRHCTEIFIDVFAEHDPEWARVQADRLADKAKRKPSS